MADTASLVARVKTEGVEQAARQLDDLSDAASGAEAAADKLVPAIVNVDNTSKKVDKTVKSTSDRFDILVSAIKAVSTSVSGLYPLLEKANTASQTIGATSKTTASSLDTVSTAVKKTTTSISTIDTSAKAANDGLARFRNTAGQVGFQVQDMVVQLQGGTSAFVAIGQQGSQLAGAFGPGGAVLGAVIALASAVGGVLYKSLNSSKSSLEDVEKGAKSLSSSFQTTKDGTIELSDAMVTLSQNGDLAYGSLVKLVGLQAQQQLQNTTNAIKTQSSEWLGNSVAAQTASAQIDDMIKKNQDVASILSNVNVVTDASSAAYAGLAGQVNDIAAGYGLTTKEVSDLLVAQRQFNSEPTAANAQKIADALTVAAGAATENKKEILDQAVETQKLANALSVAEKQLDAATDAQKRNGAAVNSTTKAYADQTAAIIKSQQVSILGDRDRATAQAQIDKDAFAKRQGVTKEDIAAYNKARDEEANQDIARVNEREQKKTDAANNAAQKREDSAAKRAEAQAAQQKKAADSFIDQVNRTGADEIANINETEQQKLDKLAEFQQAGAISAQAYEDTKTKIQLDADAARQEELDKRKKDQQEKDAKGEDFMNQILGQNATELELLDIQQKSKEDMAQAYYDKGLINEGQYQQAIASIQQNYDKKRVNSYSDMLGTTTDNLRTALGEGNKMYKAFAIANAIMNTYQGAVAAFQSAAAIPIVGWIAAPIAAAAAVAAGLANVAKIRSAREQGGNLAAGQASTIAERNKAEVIVPASASRVRTAQQMRQIMGDDSRNSGTGDVQIVNQTTGRIDSATSERTDEGRLRIIIRETVSGDFTDSNSTIAKSRRGTRGQPGY